MNIVLFGDSFLGRFNKSLIEKLESEVDDATVYNCAAGGWNSSHLAKRAQLIASLNADSVILSLGANDVAPWKEGISKQTFIDNFNEIVTAFDGAKILLLLCPDVRVESAEQTVEFNTRLAEYYAAISDRASTSGVIVVDTNWVLAELDEYHEDDGLHVSSPAYDLIITQLARELRV